jgi:hypothetical protein
MNGAIAQRLAEIRAESTKYPRMPWSSNIITFLLDLIDTLTARAEKAETERDALRTLMRHVFEYVKDDPWLTPNFRDEIRAAAEGGE